MSARVRLLVAALAGFASVLGGAGAARADWFVDADVGVVHETNVGLAQLGRDTRSDTAATTSLAGGFTLPLTDRLLATAAAEATGLRWIRLTGLNSASVGPTVALRHKFGLGPEVPWARVFASGARLEHETDDRDQWRYRLGVAVGKRWAERFDLRAEYTYEQRVADYGRRIVRVLPGDAFDIESHTWAVRGDVLLTESLSVSAGYALREGEVVSTTQRNAQVFRASEALTDDPAFGPGYFAYRVDATVHVLSVGLSYVLGRRWTVHAGYDQQIAEASADLHYTNHVVRAGVFFRY